MRYALSGMMIDFYLFEISSLEEVRVVLNLMGRWATVLYTRLVIILISQSFSVDTKHVGCIKDVRDLTS